MPRRRHQRNCAVVSGRGYAARLALLVWLCSSACFQGALSTACGACRSWLSCSARRPAAAVARAAPCTCLTASTAWWVLCSPAQKGFGGRARGCRVTQPKKRGGGGGGGVVGAAPCSPEGGERGHAWAPACALPAAGMPVRRVRLSAGIASPAAPPGRACWPSAVDSAVHPRVGPAPLQLGGYAFIGEGIPVGLGAAFQIAYNQRVLGNEQDDRVSVNFFGDGTCNVGERARPHLGPGLWLEVCAIRLQAGALTDGLGHVQAPAMRHAFWAPTFGHGSASQAASRY